LFLNFNSKKSSANADSALKKCADMQCNERIIIRNAGTPSV